jgi:Holliday junction resolvasome RuvABC endonuclease subunit
MYNDQIKNMLCLDLSLTHTGWSVFKDEYLYSFGVIPVSNNKFSSSERIYYIVENILSIVTLHDIDVVVIEDVYFKLNMNTFGQLCELRGAILSILYPIVGNNIFILPATHVRSCFELKSKEDVYTYINTIMPELNFNFEEHNDICDSIMLGLSFLDKSKVIKTKKMLSIEKKLDEPLEKYLLREYWVNEVSLKQLAKRLKISYGSIYNWFNNIKIPIKTLKHSTETLPDHLTYEQEQVLVGTVMGGGGIFKGPSTRGEYFLQIGHSIKQVEYLDHKANYFFDSGFYGYRNEYTAHCKGSDKYNVPDGFFDMVIFRTVSHNIFSKYRKIFYVNNVKVVLDDVLNLFDAFGVAIWYMDDGSFDKKSYRIRICSFSFTEEENLKIVDWFKHKFNISTKIMRDKKEYTREGEVEWYYGIEINKKLEVTKFIELITPYIIPSMFYKIGINNY